LLTLRKLQRSNKKIKNRYIINMANTRRENRIKKLQRSKKKIYNEVKKKIYGGKLLANQLSNKVVPNVNNLQDQLTNKLTNSLPNMNNLQDQLPSKTIPQGKNVFSNLMSVGAQIANKGINYGLNSIAKLTGTDPNLSVDESVNALKNKAQNIANVISNTDLGNQLGEELSQATNKILGPAVEKGSDIINELAKKEEQAVVGLGANLAEDIAYPIVAPIRTALSGLQVVENATEAASEATGVLKEQVEAYNEVKDKIGETIEEITDIASKNIVPESLRPESLRPESLRPESLSPESLRPESLSPESLKPNIITPELSDQSLKQINKESSMIGGRIRKSQLDFLKPFVNSAKILKKIGGNLRTKKRNFIKRKTLTHRR